MRATAIAAAALLAILILSASPASAQRCFTSSDDHRFPCGAGVDMMGQRMGFEPINPARAFRRGKGATDVQVVAHPSGCPRELFCGCGVSIKVFGHSVRSLWPSAAWLKYPKVAAAAGTVGWYPGHVSYIEQVHSDGTATVYDPNSGKGLTRVQRVPLSIYHKFVRPTGHAAAEPEVKVAQLASADPSLVLTDESPKEDELHKVANNALFAIYNEYQNEKPVLPVIRKLKAVPEGSVAEEIDRAAALFRLDPRMMRSFARIESSYGCKNKTGSYKGLFQLSDYEFKRYGAGGDIWNCRDNAIASAYKFVMEGAVFQHVTKREPTFFDRYCVHQQGFEGCLQHQTKPDRAAWQSMCATQEGKTKGVKWCKRAIWGNVPSNLKRFIKGGVAAITSGSFLDMWKVRVDKYAMAGDHITPPKYASAKKVKKTKKKRRHYRTKLA